MFKGAPLLWLTDYSLHGPPKQWWKYSSEETPPICCPEGVAGWKMVSPTLSCSRPVSRSVCLTSLFALSWENNSCKQNPDPLHYLSTKVGTNGGLANQSPQLREDQ